MANKITVLQSTREDHGAPVHRALYWYTISPAIQDSTGARVVPQTRANVPADAARYLSETDLAALDAGDAGFEVMQRQQTSGEAGPALTARLLADHAARQAWWIAARRQEMQFAGVGVS